MYIKLMHNENNIKLFGNYNFIKVEQVTTKDDIALDAMIFISNDSNEGEVCFDIIGYKENGERDYIRAQALVYVLNDNGKTMDRYNLAIKQ